MKPFTHAEISAKKYGGVAADYQKIHDWFDQTKAHHADMRHRAIYHNAWGIFQAEAFFGTYIINSEGKEVQVRDIGEDHVLQDLGRIPALTEMLQQIPMDNIAFFARPPSETRTLTLDELAQGISGSGGGQDQEAFYDAGKSDDIILD